MSDLLVDAIGLLFKLWTSKISTVCHSSAVAVSDCLAVSYSRLSTKVVIIRFYPARECEQ